MTKVGLAAVAGVLVVIAAVAVPPSDAAPAGTDPVHVDRSFKVLAEAYPMQSAPGTQETEIKVRFASSRAIASNPPVGAFAHASAADLGLAEAYVGRQGPSADADTATQGDDDAVVADGGSRMEAHVDATPRASSAATSSSAEGEPGGAGTVASTSVADGSPRRLVATAAAEINDFHLGLLVLGSGRFEAVASIDGNPGGARAAGFIRTTEATFAGIPISLGTDGVRVDETKVPVPLLGEATKAIQQAFSPGGYIDLRVAQPTIEIAEDGTSARVFGGGIFIYLTNNDPTERYFVSYTLLGGTASAVLGGVLAQATPDRDPRVAPTVVAPTAPILFSHPNPAPSNPRAGSSPMQPALDVVMGSERVALPGLWPGWVWSLVVVGLGWGIAGALRLPPLARSRERLVHVADELAHRYLRG